MSAADLGKFAQGFASWRQILGTVPAQDRPRIFANAAREIAGFVSDGLDRVLAADELTEMAIACGLEDLDAVQAIIADAFEKSDTGKRKGNGHDAKRRVAVMPKDNFVARFKPLSYLIEGILQRGFIYALTGATSHAKSAIALAIAELVSSPDRNAMFGKHRVEKGRVLYFVGENPDDIRMRVIGADSLRTDLHPEKDELYFIVGQVEIEKHFTEIRDGVAAIGGVDLVIVDTSAAYFLGDEELSNTQMGGHARMLRKLTELPGNPCVLVLCHPVKHAQDWTQLLPRGGGAFLAEMDGNLTAWKHDEVLVDLNYTKMRGPGFEPMTLKLEVIHTTRLVDDKGRVLPTVRAVAVSQGEEDQQSGRLLDDENRVLVQMMYRPNQSLADLARAIGWLNDKDEPLKARVQRAVTRLEKEKPILVRKARGQWELTDKGKEIATQAARTMPVNEPKQEALL
jgi:hypothetical protein